MSDEKNEIAVKYDIDGNEIKLTMKSVQDYIVGTDAKITISEFKFFTELCKVQKLNPYLKEAYCIKYGNSPATIVVSKDVIIKRAVQHPMYDGKETGIIVKTENGEIVERNGCFKLPKDEVIGGWARIYRKDWGHPECMSVSFEEVAQRKRDGSLNANWAGKSATMIEKVAKVRAMREAFPDQLNGLYASEEFGVPETQSKNAIQQAPPEIEQQPEPEIIDSPELEFEKQISFDEL